MMLTMMNLLKCQIKFLLKTYSVQISNLLPTKFGGPLDLIYMEILVDRIVINTDCLVTIRDLSNIIHIILTLGPWSVDF